MKILLTENFEKTSKFIFDFYDFDKDGYISKEDIRIVLSYVPLSVNSKDSKSKFSVEYSENKSNNLASTNKNME